MTKVLEKSFRALRRRFIKRRGLKSSKYQVSAIESALGAEQQDNCAEGEDSAFDGWVIIRAIEPIKLENSAGGAEEDSITEDHCLEDDEPPQTGRLTGTISYTTSYCTVKDSCTQDVATCLITVVQPNLSQSFLAILIPTIRRGFDVHDRYLLPITNKLFKRLVATVLSPAWQWSRLGLELVEVLITDYALEYAPLKLLEQILRHTTLIGVAAFTALCRRVVDYLTSGMPKLSSRRRKKILRMLAEAQDSALGPELEVEDVAYCSSEERR